MSHTRLLTAVTLVVAGSTPYAAIHAAQPSPADWEAALTAPWAAPGTPPALTALRSINPEYDFMARTFTVLALADRALAEPETAADRLVVIDAILDDTLAQDVAHGPRHWLLPYADARPWVGDGRSLFVDGEVLVMLGARRLVADDRPALRAEMDRRATRVVESFGAGGPRFLAESYPDEGWTFCHTLALVGLRMHEVLDGADHGATRAAWLAEARAALVDPQTGMLVSEFDLAGRVGDGPEGSSLWLSAVALRVLDPELADQQYALARQHLGRDVLGLAWSTEWPAGTAPVEDVDSGPIVPVIGASASASGMALAASRAFGDSTWNRQLTRSLGAAELVLRADPRLAEMADNPVGHAVLWWATGFGPVWARLEAAPVTPPRTG